MAYFFQLLANAAPIAALYAALAFGYAIAFAVTRRADMTYGVLFAFSGQMFLLFTAIGWDRLWLILPAALTFGAAAALLLSVGAGAAIGRFVMRPLANVSPNAVIVASLGLLMVLMEGARLAAHTRQLWLPPILSGAVVLWEDGRFPVTLTLIQLLDIAASAVMIAIGWLVLARTRFGRLWKAVSDDPKAAELCAVNTGLVFVTAYAIASLYAALCGLIATSRYGTMDFSDGLLFGFKVVLVAAAGGARHPLRAAFGAALIGIAETLWTGYGPTAWRDFAVISGLVLILVLSRREKVVV
jgi:branched-chain amino acid transport system permease protein